MNKDSYIAYKGNQNWLVIIACLSVGEMEEHCTVCGSGGLDVEAISISSPCCLRINEQCFIYCLCGENGDRNEEAEGICAGNPNQIIIIVCVSVRETEENCELCEIELNSTFRKLCDTDTT